MGAQLRQIRRRIRSVQSTKKITKAMEMIAASQIRRAQQAMKRSLPYARQITQAIEDITSQASSIDHPLLDERADPSSAAVLVITSDRGLCGAYNSNILRHAEQLVARLANEGKEAKTYVTGRKGESYFRFRRRDIEDSWEGFSERPSYDDAKEVADAMIRSFTEGEVDEIHVVYTHFESALVQRPEARRMVPMEIEEHEREEGTENHYIFEPEPIAILDALLPRYVEARVFTSLLEAAASEHAARQRAMSAASDNAEDLITNLTRVANQARQTEITTEIMEIIGASEALSQTGSEL